MDRHGSNDWADEGFFLQRGYAINEIIGWMKSPTYSGVGNERKDVLPSRMIVSYSYISSLFFRWKIVNIIFTLDLELMLHTHFDSLEVEDDYTLI